SRVATDSDPARHRGQPARRRPKLPERSSISWIPSLPLSVCGKRRFDVIRLFQGLIEKTREHRPEYEGPADRREISSERRWRRGWDSNPRYGCPYAAFRVRYIQPLCHLSGTC